MLDRGQLDIVIGYAASGDQQALKIAPMRWLGDEALTERDALPLAVLEKPCRFREAAIAALNLAGVPWRIAVETPNLTTLRAAVAAGLAVTCRTDVFLRDLPVIAADRLPPLPDVSCILLAREQAGDASRHLADLAADLIREL
jgi:DNA-binding transcriptional LysR family regulator